MADGVRQVLEWDERWRRRWRRRPSLRRALEESPEGAEAGVLIGDVSNPIRNNVHQEKGSRSTASASSSPDLSTGANDLATYKIQTGSPYNPASIRPLAFVDENRRRGKIQEITRRAMSSGYKVADEVHVGGQKGVPSEWETGSCVLGHARDSRFGGGGFRSRSVTASKQ